MLDLNFFLLFQWSACKLAGVVKCTSTINKVLTFLLIFQTTNATALTHKNGKNVATMGYNERNARTIMVVVLITLYKMYPGASRGLDQ